MSIQRKKYCQIKSCPNNRGTFDRTFRVPRCDPSIREKWVKAIKDHDPGFQDHTAQFVNVCVRHFDSDDIYESGKNRVIKLRPGAFPKNFVDPLEVERGPNDMLMRRDQSNSTQIPQNSVRLVKIVVKKNTNISKGVEKVVTCTGCLSSEAEMEATRQKILNVEHELAEQRNEMNYLKKSIKFISKPRLQLGICELCQKRLPFDELDTHFCINNGQTSIQCDYCSLMFQSTSKLLEHLSLFHDDKTFVECNECNAKFEMDALLEVHKTIHQNGLGLDDLHHWKKNHSSDGYQCGSCGEIFQTARILRSHKKRHHLNVEQKEKLFECYVCKEALGSLSQVRYHLSNGHRSSMRCTLCKCSLDDYQIEHHLCRAADSIKCDYCSRTFVSVVGILKHLEDDHEHTKTVHQCNDCNKYYYMKLLLDYHSIFHETNEKSHICYICGKFYFKAVHLSVHIRNIHRTEKSFLCVHCGSAFKRRYDLKIHLESHADRTLQCPYCPMVFRHLRSLNSHKEQHSNINYVCGTCNVELKTKFTFREHMRKHNGQTDKKKHECSFCSRMFAFRNDLIAHTRKHTGEKPIQCEYCDSKFRYKSSLKLHLRSHFGDKIYFCKKPNCGERFQFAKELQEHLAEHYKVEMETMNMGSFTIVNV